MENNESTIFMLAKQFEYLKNIRDSLGKNGRLELDASNDYTEIDQILQTLCGFKYFKAAEQNEGEIKL